MKFSAIKRTLDGSEIENYGELTAAQLKELGRTFIPEVFADEAALAAAITVIKAEGCDDWFIPGPAVINIRRVGE